MALSVITLTTRLAPPGIAPLSPLSSVLVLSASFLRSSEYSDLLPVVTEIDEILAAVPAELLFPLVHIHLCNP